MGKWNGLSGLTNIIACSTQGSCGGLIKLELQFKKECQSFSKEETLPNSIKRQRVCHNKNTS